MFNLKINKKSRGAKTKDNWFLDANGISQENPLIIDVPVRNVKQYLIELIDLLILEVEQHNE